MTHDQNRADVEALLRSVFGAAADALDVDAQRGEHLWTADNGDRAYGRREGEDSVITLVRADGRTSTEQRTPGHYRDLR